MNESNYSETLNLITFRLFLHKEPNFIFFSFNFNNNYLKIYQSFLKIKTEEKERKIK